MSSATWCTSRTSPASTMRPHLHAGLAADEVVVHGGEHEQRRDRREVLVRVAVAQHDELRAVLDRLVDLVAHLRRGASRMRLRRPSSTRYRPRMTWRAAAAGLRVSMCWIFASSSLSMTGKSSTTWRACSGAAVEQVALGAEPEAQRGDDLFADRVERRVRHLRELLREVVEEQPRALAEHGDRACRSPSRRAARRRVCAIGVRRMRTSSSV